MGTLIIDYLCSHRVRWSSFVGDLCSLKEQRAYVSNKIGATEQKQEVNLGSPALRSCPNIPRGETLHNAVVVWTQTFLVVFFK